jgi:Contact-dependent growth inhibition CdiA C-terminal domain
MAHITKRTSGKSIIPFGVFPERHELETAAIFLKQGLDVHFILPSRTKGSKTPDVMIDGVLWEMKSPTGSGEKTIEKQLQRAGKQSKYIIFDGRRTILGDAVIENELQKQFKLARSIKRIILIKKDGSRIELRR